MCIEGRNVYEGRLIIIEYPHNFLIGLKDDEGRQAFDAPAKNPVFSWVLYLEHRAQFLFDDSR
jgi:hypothetical protein